VAADSESDPTYWVHMRAAASAGVPTVKNIEGTAATVQGWRRAAQAYTRLGDVDHVAAPSGIQRKLSRKPDNNGTQRAR
jgi:hypothetical protein